MSNKPDYEEACPCGSGRTYENCCWVEELLDERGREIKRRNRRIAQLVEKQSPGSKEEIQHLLDKALENLNREPQSIFKGLSAEQVHRVLYKDVAASPDVVKLNRDLPPDAFADAPIVQNAMFFLRALAEQEPLKATSKGNLPLDFARKLFHKIDPPGIRGDWKIRSEEDSLAVSSLRHVLSKCGWIKFRHNNFSLTQKGRSVVAEGMTADHFEQLLYTFTRRFNWAYQDGYAELEMIQGTWLLSMYFLHKEAGEFIEVREFFRDFFRIYPDMVFENRPREVTFDDAACCYSLRLLERFCAYFGFVVVRKSKEKDWFKRKTFVRATRLFRDYFQWQVEEMDVKEMAEISELEATLSPSSTKIH